VKSFYLSFCGRDFRLRFFATELSFEADFFVQVSARWVGWQNWRFEAEISQFSAGAIGVRPRPEIE
jgi:hypothetical protein